MSSYQVICGDCREQVKKLIDDGIKIDLTITSPPYSDLRKYIGNVNFTDSVWDNNRR